MMGPGGLADELRAALAETARRRFGPERAEALGTELDALATDLARVAEAPLPAESEPGVLFVAE